MKKICSSLVLVFTMLFIFSQSAFASELGNSTTEAIPTKDLFSLNASTIVPYAVDPNAVANLTIYASSDSQNSSIPSTSGHAFITIQNYKTTSVTVGKLSGISQYKTVSIGTWGNKAEHEGLWYNLESKFISQGSYPNRVSLSMDLDATQFNTVNSLIVNSDSWSTLGNCTAFAEKVWNAVATSSKQVSNGTFNTPTALRDSIKSKAGYLTGSAVPYHYSVYYANGTGTPTRSANF